MYVLPEDVFIWFCVKKYDSFPNDTELDSIFFNSIYSEQLI